MTQPASGQLLAFEPRDLVDASAAGAVPLAPVELPRGRRPTWPTLAALAIATGLVAIGLGASAIFFDLRPESSASLGGAELQRALSIITDSRAERHTLRGSVGQITLVVATADRAVLTLDGLAAAPPGREYQAWLVPFGSATPLPLATFDGSHRVVLLSRPVPPGARVGVTLEQAGGADRPTHPLRLVVERP